MWRVTIMITGLHFCIRSPHISHACRIELPCANRGRDVTAHLSANTHGQISRIIALLYHVMLSQGVRNPARHQFSPCMEAVRCAAITLHQPRAHSRH
ncbi:hypothetical protein BKA93DRAFT_791834 [Sparassis latifolia]